MLTQLILKIQTLEDFINGRIFLYCNIFFVPSANNERTCQTRTLLRARVFVRRFGAVSEVDPVPVCDSDVIPSLSETKFTSSDCPWPHLRNWRATLGLRHFMFLLCRCCGSLLWGYGAGWTEHKQEVPHAQLSRPLFSFVHDKDVAVKERTSVF